jgi:K+ transport systems, NAD-binding component
LGEEEWEKKLLETLSPDNEASIIEIDPKICEDLATSTNALVIQGDGSNPNVLEEAGLNECDALIAATGDGKTNLVACELARRYKNIKRVVARIKDKADEGIFEELGVSDAIWEVEGITESLIFSLFNMHKIEIDEDNILVGIKIKEDNKNIGRAIKEIKLPKKGLLLVGIIREGQWIIPKSDEVIEVNDNVLFLSRRKNVNKLYERFFG